MAMKDLTEEGALERYRLVGLTTGLLNLAGARIFGKHQLYSVCGFHATLLLQFINPIGYRLNHLARGLRWSISLRRRLLLTNPLVLFYDFNNFLFWHLNPTYLLTNIGACFN